ncbi:PREDICTED: exocyst complex component 7 isoform X2 [Nicrophorus vespilloides]|uniref:Exocyst complex component 7 n=1 Tax=Nicrophorus vespilloides TaxID=110193 RepID=A0ABM1MUE3_NICVS|nr:PREDICTED: exocyst complex component 7 isoform X2 [Nicrophorus vespilloides]
MNMMDEKKFEISNKLEKEQANLLLLQERITKSAQMAKGIDTILNTFEQRLSRLEDTILPVYNETENLQKSQHNIDRTLQLLDNVIGFYEVSSRVEDIIEKGPGVVSEGGIDLELYIQSLNRLARAQKYFEKHIPQSVELENVASLFNKGSDKLHFEFKCILDKHSKPMLPVALMNLLNNDEDTSNEDVPSAPPQIPDLHMQDLIKIANWLWENQRDEFLTVYGKVRGSVLQKSMTLLRNHQRSVSGGSNHGGMGSPMFRPKFQNRHEATRKPSTRRLHQVFEKKANRMLLKASQTLEHSTGLTLGGRRSSTHLDPSNATEELDSEQEMDNYLVCVLALHKLMQNEQNLMKGVISINHQAKVFELIVREAMDNIVQDGENIAARAKRCISRHDFGAVLIIFPILKQLLSLKPEFERTFEECDANVRSKFDSILRTLHATGVKALDDFIESLRLDSVSQLPKDGTVHELTSNVLMFLEQLLEYMDTIGRVLADDPNYSSQLEKLNVSDKSKAYIGLYIKKVLVQLNHTLISKSEQYSDAALKSIFRLNNNNYVLKSLQRSNLLELYLISEPKCEEYYYNSIQEHKKAYLQSWNKLLNYITTDDFPVNLQHTDRLKDKERAFLKEKFAGFNKEIEEMMKVQRGYSIPDVELRESLKRDNKEYIIPKYNAFYNIFSVVQFTKNPEKYIKYKPDEVVTKIDKFFDVAA